MPVLNLSISVGSGKYVACFEVVIFRPPQNIAEGRLVFLSDRVREIFILHMKYLDFSVLASRCNVLVLAIELDRMDLYARLSFGEVVTDLDIRIGDGLDVEVFGDGW